MKMKASLILALGLFAGLLLARVDLPKAWAQASPAAPASPPAHLKIEHRCMVLGDNFSSEFNKLGNDGWHLATMTPKQWTATAMGALTSVQQFATNTYVACFYRELRSTVN